MRSKSMDWGHSERKEISPQNLGNPQDWKKNSWKLQSDIGYFIHRKKVLYLCMCSFLTWAANAVVLEGLASQCSCFGVVMEGNGEVREALRGEGSTQAIRWGVTAAVVVVVGGKWAIGRPTMASALGGGMKWMALRVIKARERERVMAQGEKEKRWQESKSER